MAGQRTLLGPYPGGATNEEVSEWLLHGLVGTYLPPDSPDNDNQPTLEVHLCPHCGCLDDPGDEGLCHRLLCGGLLSR
ncbi:hypothetical protein KKD80_04200 [Patescibacteria group bacterium]|nr:hypothetical protein [Patescibacteria group bacterium]